MKKNLILAVAGAFSLACVHRQPNLSSGCDGRRQAVVSNNWSEPIEVFTRIGSTPGRTYVGTVRANSRDQFLLPDGARYAFVQAVGETNPQATMPASAQNLIDIRYVCE